MQKMLWIMIAVLMFIGCSKEYQLPVAFHEDRVPQPINLKAQLMEDEIHLSWEVADTTKVHHYIVTASREEGLVYRQIILSPSQMSYVDRNLVPPVQGEGVAFFFTVQAVDSLLFESQVSNVDTVLVLMEQGI